MKPLFRPLLALFAFALALPASAQTTEATLRKAREFLGGESALGAIRSVHYRGTLESTVTTAEGETRTAEATIEILFARPFFQRIDIVAADRREITALDDFEAWQRIENPTDATQWRLTLLDAGQIRRLRANTWENLHFFGDLAAAGGRLQDFGLVDADGRKLHKIGFFHADTIVFHRYFDPQSGQLVLSETDAGAEIRESGERRAAGVRFPEQVITVTKRPDGVVQTVKVTFDSVKVNDPVDPALFRVPSVTGR